MEIISEAYSLTNQKMSNETQKNMLYKAFVAWNYDRCSIAPPTDYVINSIYQELPDQDTHFNTFDERIYLDLRDSMGYTNEMEKWTKKRFQITFDDWTKQSLR